MILVSPMAPASGPAPLRCLLGEAGPGLSGGGGGSGARRGPAAYPAPRAGRGASSLVLQPLPGPSAACRGRGRRFLLPTLPARPTRRLFRWPRPSRRWAAARSTPAPDPGAPRPARPRPRPPPSCSGLAADGLALRRTRGGHPAHPPAVLGSCALVPGPGGAWRWSPTPPGADG